jgi:hypothetical protein
MNKLIDELSLEAEEFADLDDKDSGNWLSIYTEKLAELIVQECSKQCSPEPGIKYSPNSFSARLDCKRKIEELLK